MVARARQCAVGVNSAYRWLATEEGVGLSGVVHIPVHLHATSARRARKGHHPTAVRRALPAPQRFLTNRFSPSRSESSDISRSS